MMLIVALALCTALSVHGTEDSDAASSRYSNPISNTGYGGSYAEVQRGPHSLYPQLTDFLGMNVDDLEEAMSHVISSHEGDLPISLTRIEESTGVRNVVLTNPRWETLGMNLQKVNDSGLYVTFVEPGSPAQKASVHVADEVLLVNGTSVEGQTTKTVIETLNQTGGADISLAIRDRPYEKTFSIQKDSTGSIGFEYENGRITNVLVDSSAAQYGLPTGFNVVEVNGQNVVGLSDGDVQELMGLFDDSYAVTVLPGFIYDQIIQALGPSLVLKQYASTGTGVSGVQESMAP